jgi:hypothetical protein
VAAAHIRPGAGEVRWRQDLELQRVGDPVDQAEGKGDLREVADAS